MIQIKLEYGINSDVENAPQTVNGTILAKTNTSKIGIYVTPLKKLEQDDSVKITVTASTSAPYQKTISAEFTLKVKTQGSNTYSIEDVENRDYAILKLTSPEESSTVTLEFDPSILRIDTNNEVYIKRDDSKTVTTTIDGKEYVKTIVFNLEEEKTRYVKFYKVDKTKNYTYPGVQATSPIKVSI